jgi:hypothetical protein
MGRSVRNLAVVTAGFVIASVVAAAGFGLLSTLRGPARSDLLGVRALTKLERVKVVDVSIHLAGERPFSAVCRRLGKRDLIVADGNRLLVEGSRVRRIAGRKVSPALLVAEADLSACPVLLADELVSLLLRGGLQTPDAVQWHGRPVYRFRLSRGRPVVDFYASQTVLAPVGVAFASKSRHGWSVVE